MKGIRLQPQEPDETGRKRPIPIHDSEFEPEEIKRNSWVLRLKSLFERVLIWILVEQEKKLVELRSKVKDREEKEG